MKIKIIKSHKNSHYAVGLAVVIDVLRAFSTACFVLNNNAEKIIPVASLEEAYKLKKENPGFVLMGEREGKKPEGFDYGNSPFEILNIDLSQKTVIQTTTMGTRGITHAVKAEEIITGAFVNAQAIINYIKKRNPEVVSLVCTHDSDMNEDVVLAEYIKEYLEENFWSGNFLKKEIKDKVDGNYDKNDFNLCIDFNKFDFVIKAEINKKDIYLKKVNL